MPYKNKKTQYGLIRLYPYRVVELYRTTVFRLEDKDNRFYVMNLFLEFQTELHAVILASKGSDCLESRIAGR